MIATAAYVATIVAVNWLFSVVPMVELPGGVMFPPVALIVGFVFVLRDIAQRAVGHWVLAAMALGVASSYAMADPYVATASAVAFAISEAIDWAIYSVMKKPMADRILISSAVSTPIDSIVFLTMIGAFGWVGAALMTASKMIGAIVVWALWR
jgi:uncharacterized PurR-regulated membrane protein YhhQ (DUF165 family)